MSRIEMSRIERGLKKLRNGGESQPGPTELPDIERVSDKASAVPLARKRPIETGGKRFAVSQDSLMRAGLLAPLQHAVPVADEFRRIKRPLIANALNQELTSDSFNNVIMISSALPGAGKTFCTVNLAVSISLERDLKVLLIDADVAKPHISREFGLADAPGLIDLLADESRSIDETLVHTDLNDIEVLPAGQIHPQATELLASDRMVRVLKEVATRYSDRIVLLDSPPLLLTSEAQVLASQVGQIALVVEAGKTSHQELAQVIEMLAADKAVNLILNKSRRGKSSREYGDEYANYTYQAN